MNNTAPVGQLQRRFTSCLMIQAAHLPSWFKNVKWWVSKMESVDMTTHPLFTPPLNTVTPSSSSSASHSPPDLNGLRLCPLSPPFLFFLLLHPPPPLCPFPSHLIYSLPPSLYPWHLLPLLLSVNPVSLLPDSFLTSFSASLLHHSLHSFSSITVLSQLAVYS